jgi:hypothetical protein
VEAFRRCTAVTQWPEEAAFACFKAAICFCRLGRYEAALDTCVHGLARQAAMPELAWQAVINSLLDRRHAIAGSLSGAGRARHPPDKKSSAELDGPFKSVILSRLGGK